MESVIRLKVAVAAAAGAAASSSSRPAGSADAQQFGSRAQRALRIRQRADAALGLHDRSRRQLADERRDRLGRRSLGAEPGGADHAVAAGGLRHPSGQPPGSGLQ